MPKAENQAKTCSHFISNISYLKGCSRVYNIRNILLRSAGNGGKNPVHQPT